MSRLTRKIENDSSNDYSIRCENCPKHGKCYDSAHCIDVLVNRLAKYEDAEEAGLIVLPKEASWDNDGKKAD